MKETHIVLGVTGSIAAYKAVELVRSFRQRGWAVTVMMTEAAAEFVGELTFRTLSQNNVYRDMFSNNGDWMPEHIDLASRGDVMLIAPCTANVMAKIAHGLADDLLTATVLASPVPVVIAPAMNELMWNNQATQENVRTLTARGIKVLDTESGDLACGSKGAGRLVPVAAIIAAVEKMILAGKAK